MRRTRHIGKRPVLEQRIADLLGVFHIPQTLGILLHARYAEGAAL